MNTSWIHKGTRWFFWCGFGVFLAASIPHIAMYFRHFDPVTTDASNVFYWLIAYALAIVLDISDVLVSIAVMKAQGEGRRVRDVLPYWFFIAFITAFSWFVNWQYNVVFGTAQFHTVDAYHIGIVSIGQINPIIGSAFQLLLLVYTGMAHKFSQHVERTEKSLDDLKQEAEEATQRAALLRAIQDAKKEGKTSVIQHLKGAALETKQAINEVLSSPEKTGISPAINVLENAVIDPPKERHTDPLLEQVTILEDASFDTSITKTKDEEKALDSPPYERQKDEDKNTASHKDSGRSTVTINEAATMLNTSVKQVRIWRTKGMLKTAPRNKELLTIKSINALLESRNKTMHKTTSPESINTTQNGHTPRLNVDELVPLEV